MVEVVLVRARVRAGLPEVLLEVLVTLRALLGGNAIVERAFRRVTVPVLGEEGMYTESIFLERTGNGYALPWYMEAEDVEGVNEADRSSSNPLTTLSERVLGRCFEDPERIYGTTEAGGDFDLLVHVSNPDRP